MKRKIKYVIIFSTVIICFLFAGKTTHAATLKQGWVPGEVTGHFKAITNNYTDFDSASNLYLDKDSNLWMISKDSIATTTTTYQTAGFKVTRCVEGTKTPIDSDFFVLIKNDSHRTDIYGKTGEEYYVSYHKFSKELILSQIQRVSSEWYNDIVRNENEIYVKFDSIIRVITRVKIKEEISEEKSGDLEPINRTDDILKNVGKVENGKILYNGYLTFTEHEFKTNSRDKKGKLINWSNATNQKIANRFNNFFLFSPFGPPKESTYVDDATDMVLLSKPNYWTSNESKTGEYIIGEGIPTSEDIVNKVGANLWIGSYGYNKVVVKHNYSIKIKFNFTDAKYLLSNSSNEWVPVTSMEKEIVVTKENFYYTLNNLWVRGLKNIKVYNETYPTGNLKYSVNHTIAIDAVAHRDSGDYNLFIESDRLNPETVIGDTKASHARILEVGQHLLEVTIDKEFKELSLTGLEEKLTVEMYDYIDKNMSYFKSLFPDIQVRNDRLAIDGKVYMDDTWTYDVIEAETIDIDELPMYEATVQYTIPKSVKNGTYPTYMQVEYASYIPNGNGAVYAYTSKESDEHIVKEVDNKKVEPIVVHTPVISPIKIYENNTDKNGVTTKKDVTNEFCQLVNPNTINLYNLLLDGSYTLEFVEGTHCDLQGYGYSGNESKYDKYTSFKMARFPFEVRIGSIYYPANQWITVGNSTEFYIPTWAKESDAYTVEVMVVAENFDGDIDYSNFTENSANLDLSNYIATYAISCSLSGQIYDFSVVGVTDAELFYWSLDKIRQRGEDGKYEYTKEYKDFIGTWGNWDYSFWLNDEHRRAGANNRFGNPYVRDKDGNIIPEWDPVESLPLTQGSSHAWKEMMMPVGETLSFTLKTIGEYDTDGQDFIYIKPVYRFVELDGTLHEPDTISVYYDDGSDLFIQYGDTRDLKKWKNTTLLGHNQRLKGIFTDEDKLFKLTWWRTQGYDFTQYYIETHPFRTHCCSQIILPAGMMYYTGREEELRLNQFKSSNEVFALNLTDEQRHDFTSSIQTWYGEYTIPNDIYVCDSSVDLPKYSKENDLSYLSDIWYREGYLVLSFEIYSYQDRQPHLVYNNSKNGMCNMWKVEGANNPKSVIKNWHNGVKYTTEILLKYGDVAIMNIAENWQDNLTEVEFLFIN